MIIEWSQVLAGEQKGDITRVNGVGDLLLGTVDDAMIADLGGDPLVEIERCDAADSLVPQYSILKFIPRQKTEAYFASKQLDFDSVVGEMYTFTDGSPRKPFWPRILIGESSSYEQKQEVYNRLVAEKLAKPFSGPLLQITHNGVRKAEQLLLQADAKHWVQARKQNRIDFLKEVYYANTSSVDLKSIADTKRLNGAELEDSYYYLIAENWVEIRGGGYGVAITQFGKDYVESILLGSDNKETMEIFFCYSHADEALRDKLDAHLQGLKRQKIISGWHDRQITAGSDWDGAIDVNLNKARIILLLISADFMNSSYCCNTEMKQAAVRHESGEAVAMPIILRHCDWGDLPFGENNLKLGSLQALPKDAKPITSWTDVDEAFLNVVEGIKNAIKKIKLLS